MITTEEKNAIPQGWNQVLADEVVQQGDMCWDYEKRSYVPVPANCMGKMTWYFLVIIRKQFPETL